MTQVRPAHDHPTLKELVTKLAEANTGLLGDTKVFFDIAKNKRANFDHESIYDVCFWYKCLALALLVHVEAVCTLMRESVASHASELGVDLTPRQARRITEDQHKIPYVEGVRLAFLHYPRLFGVDLGGRLSGTKFRAFRELALYYREGLHHPKLLIHTYPLGLFRILIPAAEWFLHSIRGVLTLCAESAGVERRGTAGYAERFDYEPHGIEAMNRVTQQLLQSELDSEPHDQFRYFLDFTTSDVAKAADFWNKGGGAWKERVARQLELRNFVRVLNAAIEGVTLASARILDEVGMGLGEARGLLQGDPSDVAENIAATAEKFSEEFGFARNLPRADEGWRMIPDFRRLKNRINHPDGIADLEISESEARRVLSVATWYSRQLLECVQPRPDVALWSNIPRSLLGEVPKN